MKYNVQVVVTRHATERYLERFIHAIHTGDAEEDRRVAERFLQEAWSTARYISDDAEGILFRSDDIDIIIKGRRLVTVMRPSERRAKEFGARTERGRFCNRRTSKESLGNKEGAHIPPGLRKIFQIKQ